MSQTQVALSSTHEEFNVLESFPNAKGRDRLYLLTEDIRRFLLQKIHPKGKDDLYYVQVEGSNKAKLFEPYDAGGELGLHGGQISIFSYLNKEKDEGIVTGVNHRGIDNQADAFWKIMDSRKGHIDVHLVYFEGPGEKDLPPFGSKPVYDGKEMTAYRFRFRLQRKAKSLTVILYNLRIYKENWNRSEKERLE